MYNIEKEVREAIAAGNRALDSLYLANRKLDSASGWGVMDLLGGRWFTGLMKHSNLSDASGYLYQAKQEIERFRSELGDIRDIPDMRDEIDDFLTFADFFFDGPLADLIVQSRIHETRRRIENTISSLERVIRELRNYQ